MTKSLIKILLIEDNAADALLIKASLGDDPLADFQVTVADRLGQGLVELGHGNFDALLLDLGLPDSHGLKTFESVYAKFPNIPIIVLSGMMDEFLALQAVQSGAQDYLVKGKAGWNLAPRAIRHAIERHQFQLAMRASEKRYQALIENAPDGVVLIGMDGRYKYASPAALRMFNYKAEDVVGSDPNEQTHPDDLSMVLTVLQDLIANPSNTPTIQYRFKNKNGSWRWVESTFTNLLAEPGVEAIVINFRDITERKQAQDAQQQSEFQFRTLFDLSPDAVMLIDTHDPDISWPIIDCNEAACLMNGYRRDELIGHSIDIVNVNTATQAERDAYLQQLQEKGHLKLESFHRHKNGTIFPIEVSTTLIKVGERELLIGIDRDITERKQAEKALNESQRKLETLMANLPGMAFRCKNDPEWTMEFVSEGCFPLTGYHPFELVNNSRISYGQVIHPEDRSMVSDIIQSKLGKKYQLNYRIVTASGEERWVWEQGQGVYEADGTLIALEGFIADITERKRAEKALHESKEQSHLAHDAAELGTWAQDLVSQNFHFDQRAQQHYDLDEAHVTAQTIAARLHPEDAPLLRREIERSAAMPIGGRVTAEYRVIHRDGSIHWVVVHARAHYAEHDGKQTPIMVVGTSQDITERKDSEQKLIQRTQQLRLINESTRRLNASLKAHHVYDVIYTSISKLMPCDTLFISSFDPDSKMITLSGGWHDGQPMDISKYEPIPLEPEGSGTQSQVIRSKESLLVPDFQARLKKTRVVQHFDGNGNPQQDPPQDEDIPRSALVVPLIIENEVFGVIQVFSYKMNAYTEDDLEILNGFSSQAAISLSNARLYENIQQENLERKKAEESLAESERRFRSIFETSGMGIFESTAEGQIIHINASYARMFGFESVEDAKQGITDIAEGIYTHPEKRAQFINYVLEHPGMSSFENEYRRHDGTTFIGDLKLQAMRSAENKNTYLFGYVEDITRRKQAETEIRERTEDLELINKLNEAVNRGESLNGVIELFARELGRISLCKDATIYLLSPDGKNLVMQHLSISPAVLKEIEHIIGRPLPQVEIPIQEGGYFQDALLSEEGIITTDPKTIQKWMGEFTQTNYLPTAIRGPIRKFIPQIYNLLGIRSTLILPLISDKKIIGLLDVSSANILTEKDLHRIRKISGQVTAVILREQTNQALLESENRYRSIFDGAQDAILVEAKDGRILSANSSACRMYGYTLAEFGNKTVKDLVPEGRKLFVPPEMQSTISRAPLETINRRANGELFPVEISGGLQSINGEEVLLVTVRDITNRKQTEAALHESEQKYKALFDEMLSGVAVHEIICDSQGEPIDYRFIAINAAFEKMTGLTSEAVIGKRVLEVLPATESSWIKRYGRVALTRIPIQFENYSSEMEKYFEVRAFSPEKGKFATIFNDITERKQTEEALNESKLLFHLLIESLPQNIYAKDADGRFIFANQNYCITHGSPLDEILGKTDFDLHPAELAEKYLLDDEQVIKTGKTFELEEEHQPIGGKKTYVQVIKTPFFYSKGQPAGILGIFWDITERKQTEENTRQRVKALELLYENSLTVNQSLNPKEITQKVIELLGEKLDWHHTAIRLFNEQDNSLELAAFDLQGIREEQENESLVHLRKVISNIGEGLSGWAIQQSKTLRLGDVSSDPHYVESYPGIHSGLYAPLKSGDHILGVISIESEKPNAFSEADEQLIITLANQAAVALENARLYGEISQHAEKLEQSVRERTAEIEATRQRLELAVKTAGIGIWELDIKQNKDYWDDRLFALYGLSSGSSQPNPQTWRKALHPDDLDEQLRLMDEALHNNQPYNTEFRVILPDGNIRHIKSTGLVITGATGEAERMIGANQDITIHKQAEETLSLANAEMERGLRMKNEFLANMSHELRTPLNAILGISESLEEQISGALNEKQLRYIRTIIESGRHLLDLINDILDLSKIEAGKFELNIQSISVEKLCTTSLRMIKELAQKKSLSVSLKIDENVKFISGDERRLKQSLVNLLGNAVKFTPQEKQIGLEVKGDGLKNEVTFTVWDEGIGIEQENIQHLFKPFVQLNAGLAREYSGTGLGLALVAQMVRLHGGRISLTSKLNIGSRFIITLPWTQAEQEIQPQAQFQVLENNPISKANRTGKILIVDDTEVVAQLMSEYLQHKGYETFIAYNGQEGVMLARQVRPQLILMDVMMPILNGLEATKQIRADAALQDIPIIGLTALAMSSDREQCLAAGMNDHLGKPIEMQELIKIIERYLAKNR